MVKMLSAEAVVMGSVNFVEFVSNISITGSQWPEEKQQRPALFFWEKKINKSFLSVLHKTQQEVAKLNPGTQIVCKHFG